jgi:putative sterol carrier protein
VSENQDSQSEASAEAIAALADADAGDLAAMAAAISDADMESAMNDAPTRKRILDEIFGRMAEHTDPAQIKDVDAVVHFKIGDAPGGGEDLYEAVIKDGTVTVNNEPTTEDPKLTIATDPVPFLKLVTGQESGPAMFMKGKLKIQGDLMFATRLTSFFKIPSAA